MNFYTDIYWWFLEECVDWKQWGGTQKRHKEVFSLIWNLYYVFHKMIDIDAKQRNCYILIG